MTTYMLVDTSPEALPRGVYDSAKDDHERPGADRIQQAAALLPCPVGDPAAV